MKQQLIEFLGNYPVAWIPILLLAPLALRYRLKKFQRATRHANDTRSKMLVFIGLIAAAAVIWAILEFT